MKRTPSTLLLIPLAALAACAAPGDSAAQGPLPTDEAGAAPTSQDAGTTSAAAPEQATETKPAEAPAESPAKTPAKKPSKKAAKKPKGPTLKELQAALDKAQRSRSEAQRKQRYAEADVELAELAAVGARMDADESVRAARSGLESARAALSNFDTVDRPLQTRESELTLAQAVERLHVAETDLVGILEIYADETEARAKDEIIRRHEKKVEVAKERLEIERGKHTALVETTLPAKMRDKAEAVRKAEASLEKAQAGATEKNRRSEIAIEKASDALADAKREAKAESRKVDAARKRVNDKRESQMPKPKAADSAPKAKAETSDA